MSTTILDRLQRALAPALVEKVPRNHHEPDEHFRRRRRVVVVVLVVGATLLGVSLATEPGSTSFYLYLLAVAATWVVGGLLSGPLHLGWHAGDSGLQRPVVTPVLLGVAAFAVFFVGALVCREIGPLRDLIASILDFARGGWLPLVVLVTLVNGAAEEVFFRGALYAGLGAHHPVLLSTGLYALATIATRNPALVFAALLMGLLFALQRRATGGILAPMITHLVWSTLMLLFLPPLFA